MSGIEHANGRRPHGLLRVTHPSLRAAPRPDREIYSAFDLDAALDACVRISATVPETFVTARTLGSEREGGGILIDDHGLVLTIGYLIVEARDIELTAADGKRIEGVPVGYDHETGFGLVRATVSPDAAPLEFGDSDKVAAGDDVVVSGFGGYDQAIGGRVIARREFAGSWEYLVDEAIFTAPMHPFWGGAALIDTKGKLVGVGSLYVEESVQGRIRVPGNMFVPVNDLKPILDTLARTGRSGVPPRPWLGMRVAETTERLVVMGVTPNGPAAHYGVEAGDVVLNVEGIPVADLAEMYRTIWKAGRAGVELRFTLLRDDDVVTVRVKSGDRYEYLDLPRRA